MTDNQELTSKELLPCPFCDGEVTQEIKESPYKDGTGSMFTSKLVHNCLEGFEAGYSGGLELFCTNNPSKDSRELIQGLAYHQRRRWNTRAPSKQLTTTQQALDTAVEALEFYAKLDNYMAELKEGEEGQRPYFDFKHTPVHMDCSKIAKAALASIKE